MRSQYFSYGRQVELSLIAIHNDTDGVGGQYQHSSGLTLYYADAKITSLSKFNSITGKLIFYFKNLQSFKPERGKKFFVHNSGQNQWEFFYNPCHCMEYINPPQIKISEIICDF